MLAVDTFASISYMPIMNEKEEAELESFCTLPVDYVDFGNKPFSQITPLLSSSTPSTERPISLWSSSKPTVPSIKPSLKD
jgi:hypothetical protein